MIIALSFNAATAEATERLCDLIYWQSGRNPTGHCLLVPAFDVHAEMKCKVKIAAEVAFASVDMFEVKHNQHGLIPAAQHISRIYKSPWLWLESDCVPLVEGWREILESEYDAQPKRYLGSPVGDKTRISIYPPDAYKELEAQADKSPAKTNLIQELLTGETEANIKEGVVLLRGNRPPQFIEALIEKTSTHIEVPIVKRRGRKPNLIIR